MITPELATGIVVAFILIFGVGVPILNKKAPKYISYRWCVIVVIMALLIGVVVDFDVLSDTARQAIIIGGLVITGVYVILRTLEKALANGWLRGTTIEVEKGDIKATVKNDSGKNKSEKQGE